MAMEASGFFVTDTDRNGALQIWMDRDGWKMEVCVFSMTEMDVNGGLQFFLTEIDGNRISISVTNRNGNFVFISIHQTHFLFSIFHVTPYPYRSVGVSPYLLKSAAPFLCTCDELPDGHW